jgi:hypothetical protein
MSMSVPDQSMTRLVINEAEHRHGQYQQIFQAAHMQSVNGIVAQAREALREQHGTLSERFTRESASLDGQRRSELVAMQSLLTADHRRQLELVENQAMHLVDSNVQHEQDSYLSRLRRMHDEMDESLNTEINARNLAVQDSEAMRAMVHDYQTEVLSLQRIYSSQLSEASLNTRRMMQLESAEAHAQQREQNASLELQAQQRERAEDRQALLALEAELAAAQTTIAMNRPIPETPPNLPPLPIVEGTPLRAVGKAEGFILSKAESFVPTRSSAQEFQIHGGTADEANTSTPLSSLTDRPSMAPSDGRDRSLIKKLDAHLGVSGISAGQPASSFELGGLIGPTREQQVLNSSSAAASAPTLAANRQGGNSGVY